MANEVPYAFPVELLKGNHDFASDTFKLALYTANPYTQSTSTVYVVTDESSGAEYSAGGNTLTSNAVTNVADIATVDFANSVWGSPTPATFDAAYGVIYNTSTSPVNKLVVVLDFLGTKSCSNGTFTVTFPDPTSGSPSGADALLSITS